MTQQSPQASHSWGLVAVRRVAKASGAQLRIWLLQPLRAEMGIAMGELCRPAHFVSSFPFSEMQLGRPRHCVGSGASVWVSGSVAVRGLGSACASALTCAHMHVAWCVCVHVCTRACVRTGADEHAHLPSPGTVIPRPGTPQPLHPMCPPPLLLGAACAFRFISWGLCIIIS